jgi:hypothetical protein
MRTGRKLHLGQEHVRVLMSEPIYQAISNAEAEEIRRACAAVVTNDNNAGTSGSGSDQTTGPGASAGSNIVPLETASRGARLRLTEAKSELQLRNKQSTH